MVDKMEKMAAPIIKQYSIKIEFLVPTTITYKVSAENEHEALKKIDKIPASQSHIRYNLQRKIKLKAVVYQGGTSMVKFTKTYRHL